MTTREPDPTPGTEGDKLIGDGDDFSFGPSATSPVLDRILARKARRKPTAATSDDVSAQLDT